MIEKACAKINLTLDIIQKREDGYHDIESIFHEISLHDIIEVNDSDKTTVECDNGPENELNICFKAVEEFKKHTGIEKNVKISIQKRIPIGAGLGGGSSDAAAVIRTLDKLWETKMDKKEIMKIAEKVGMDVPFFIRGGTALVKERGELLEKMDNFPELHLMVVQPEIKTNTKKAYESLDYEKIGKTESTKALYGKEELTPIMIAEKIHNDFVYSSEISLEKTFGIISDLKNIGALNASLTGSGSAVFGIFKEAPEKKLDKYHFSEITKTEVRK